MRRRTFGCALAVLSLLGVVPAASQASVIVGSPLNIPTNGSIGVFGGTFVQTALPEPTAALAAPVDGTVVQWSLRGTFINVEPNSFKLRVLSPVGNGTFIGAGTSAEESTPHTGSNDDMIRRFQTALPIRAGDAIGLSAIGGADVPVGEGTGATSEYFEAAFADGASSGSPTVFGGFQNREMLFNAEVVAAPTSSATVTACGKVGSVAVQVTTDPATTPKAVLFRLDGGAQQAAPANGGSATVTIPKGHHTLEYWAEDAVPQQEIAHHSTALHVSGRPCGSNAGPVLSAVSQSHTIWREGGKRFSRSGKPRPPLGTTFSFRLNEKASVSFEFTRKLAGRRVKGRCVAQTRRNRHRRACRRTIPQGVLAVAGHNGANKVAFQGRLSASKKLPPGQYTLAITATDSAGRRSQPEELTFRIVR